jgi:hypothetical protein
VQQALRQLRVIHCAFLVTWFLFILVIERVHPAAGPGEANLDSVFPLAFGFVCVSEIVVALFFRARFIAASEAVLRSEPENRAALVKWRTGNMLSFCIAETITLFGLVLKFLGFDWKTAAVFFAAGMLLLLFWMPRKIEAMPRGVR